MIPPLLLCVSQPIFYNLFPIRRANHENKTIKAITAGRQFGNKQELNFEVWFKKGVSKLCEIVFKSELNLGKKFILGPIQSIFIS